MTASLRRSSPRALLVGAALLAGAYTWLSREPVLGALREHPYFSVQSLVIEGEGPRLDERALRDWIGFTDGTTVWNASPKRIRERLRQHPYVVRATVRRRLPDQIEIRIEEREPVAVVVLDDLFYVDRAGVLFGPLHADDSSDYPIITGVGEGSSPGWRRWAMRRALRVLRRCQREGCFDGLSEVHVDRKLGAILYPASTRVQVVLGWSSTREKIRRAERVLGRWEAGRDRLVRIDARFRNQVVVEARPEERTRRPAKAPRIRRG